MVRGASGHLATQGSLGGALASEEEWPGESCLQEDGQGGWESA